MTSTVVDPYGDINQIFEVADISGPTFSVRARRHFRSSRDSLVGRRDSSPRSLVHISKRDSVSDTTIPTTPEPAVEEAVTEEVVAEEVVRRSPSRS